MNKVTRSNCRNSRRRHLRQKRSGTIVVLAAFLLIVFAAMLAFSIDLGYMYTVKAELDRAVDSAALAGASSLGDGVDEANLVAVEYLLRNPVSGGTTVTDDQQLAILRSLFLSEHEDDYALQSGDWNPETKQLETGGQLPSALSVSMEYNDLPTFFGGILGKDSFSVRSEAIAMYQPRDIMLVLDLSGSMNDDSELRSINELGRSAVESNLLQCYQELGSPTYGSLVFQPKYITVPGQPPANNSQPQISVEYRYKSVYITSTKDLSNVVLQYSNGSTYKYNGLSGKTGLFPPSGNGSKAIYKVWVKSGSNASGEGPGYGEPFNFHKNVIKSVIKTALNLDNVPYPYPSGSWNSYISYCRSSSGYNKSAGYRYQFGHMNLINYWLEKKPSHSQTPDLWKVSAQPATAVKDAVGVFMDFIQEVQTDDRVGLTVYNAYDGDGKLESALTTDYSSVELLSRQRQAGHYHSYTNIGAGMEEARLHLQQEGRAGAFKMIVLMTDGVANWVDGNYSTSGARNYVLSEASKCEGLHYPVVTVSLGAGADTGIMNTVAETTNGIHFNIPGGQTVADYSDDLKRVFRDIAKHRPLKIVR